MTPDVPLTSSAVLTAPSPSNTRLGVRALAVDVIRRPSEAFRRLAEQPGRRWVAPLVLMVLLSTLAGLAALNTPAYREFRRAVMSAQLARLNEQNPGMAASAGAATGQMEGMATTFTLVSTLIGTPITVLVAALIVAAVMHLISTLLGGQQTFSTIFTTTAWARLPLIFRAALHLAQALLGGFDPNPTGLAGLVAANPLDAAAKPSFLAPVLGQVELWNLWTLVLYVLMLQAVAQIPRRKAAIGVVALVVVQVLLGVAGVFMGRALSGLQGGGGG